VYTKNRCGGGKSVLVGFFLKQSVPTCVVRCWKRHTTAAAHFTGLTSEVYHTKKRNATGFLGIAGEKLTQKWGVTIIFLTPIFMTIPFRCAASHKIMMNGHENVACGAVPRSGSATHGFNKFEFIQTCPASNRAPLSIASLLIFYLRNGTIK
jgi:hypothetical protein